MNERTGAFCWSMSSSLISLMRMLLSTVAMLIASDNSNILSRASFASTSR